MGESSNLSGYRSWTPPPSAGAPPQTPNPRPHQAAPTTHALPDPASDHKTPPHLVVSLAPSLPEPRPPGLAQVARVSLPTPRRSRVQKGRATPALSRPRPPGSASAPWPRRDPAPYGLRSVAAAAASSCVPSSLWLVTRALHPAACQEQSGVEGAGGEFSTCVRGSWGG